MNKINNTNWQIAHRNSVDATQEDMADAKRMEGTLKILSVVMAVGVLFYAGYLCYCIIPH